MAMRFKPSLVGRGTVLMPGPSGFTSTKMRNKRPGGHSSIKGPVVAMVLGSTVGVRKLRLGSRRCASAATVEVKENIDWTSWRAGGQQMTLENFQKTPLAEYWKDLATQPFASDDILGRQAIYVKLMGMQPIAQLFGDSQVYGLPTKHFFWGYVAQLDWQWRTGRLGDEKMSISPQSWWGAMNYTLSVLPLAAAVDSGLIPLEEVKGVDFTEADRVELAAARAAWAQLWRTLQARAKTPEPLTTEELDDLGGLKWSCHTSSLEAAAALYRPLLAPLTLEESSFGEGWGSFVTLLAAVRFRTDLDFVLSTGVGYLPPQLTDLHDNSPSLRRLKVTGYEAQRMRQTVKIAQQAGKMRSQHLQLMAAFWSRATKRLVRREKAHEIILDLGKPEIKPQMMAGLRLFRWFVWP